MDYERVCYGCFGEHQGGPCPHCGYDSGKQDWPYDALPQSTILNGRYLVGRCLSVNEAGMTYVGFDLVLEVKVAIKEYFPSGAARRGRDKHTVELAQSPGDQGMERFIGRARSMARLTNAPNMVKLQNYFDENNTAYFVLDFIDGMSLEEYVGGLGGRLDYEKALALILPLGQTLVSMHSQGLPHFKISPENILVTPEGRPTLLGIGPESPLGLDKSQALSFAFGFSPVEFHLSNRERGPWSDVYSLAATLYFCLTGNKPVHSANRFTVDSLVSPADLGVKLPQEANAAIIRGMSVDGKDRPDMPSFLRALMDIIPDAAQRADNAKARENVIPDAPVPLRPSKRKLSKKALGLLCAGAAALLIVGALALILPSSRAVSASDGIQASLYENEVMSFSMKLPAGFVAQGSDAVLIERDESAQIAVLHVADTFGRAVVYDKEDFAWQLNAFDDYLGYFITGFEDMELTKEYQGALLGGMAAKVYVGAYTDSQNGDPCSTVIFVADSPSGLGCYLLFLSVSRSLDQKAFSAAYEELLGAVQTFSVTSPESYQSQLYGSLERYSDPQLGVELLYPQGAFSGGVEKIGDILTLLPPYEGDLMSQFVLYPLGHSVEQLSFEHVIDQVESVFKETFTGGFTVVSDGASFEAGRYPHSYRALTTEYGGSNMELVIAAIEVDGEYWVLASTASAENAAACAELFEWVMWSFRVV